MVHLILQGIVPVVFVLALGFLAGRKNIISEEGARDFSTYVVNFGLPCTLFVGIFGFPAREFGNVPFILTLLLSLMIPFAISIGIARRGFKNPSAEGALFACNCGYPDMAYFGLPVLLTIIGPQGLLPVIVGNLVTSILMVPAIIYMVSHGVARRAGIAGSLVRPARRNGSLLGTLINTFEQPVVWGPILGLVLVLLHIHLPELLTDSLKQVGQTTGGIALFTLGVLLSRLAITIRLPSLVVVLIKNLFMPGLAFGLSRLFHLDPLLTKGAIITTACPSATFGAMLSAKMQIGRNTIPPEILVSNVMGIFTIAFWIFVAESMGQ